MIILPIAVAVSLLNSTNRQFFAFSPDLLYYQRFGMLTSCQLRMMKGQSGLLTVPEFNDFLLLICDGNIETYLCLPQPGLGVRIRLIPTDQFETYWRSKDYSHFPPADYNDEDGITRGRVLIPDAVETGYTADLLPPVISTWVCDEIGLHRHKIDYRSLETCEDVYVDGFGTRARAMSKGLNVYTGKRGSKQAGPNPTEGPGSVDEGQYWRQ